MRLFPAVGAMAHTRSVPHHSLHLAASPVPPNNPVATSVTVPIAQLIGVAVVVIALLFLLLIVLMRRSKTSRQSASAKLRETSRIAHFIPNEIVLVVQHAPSLTKGQLIGGVAQDPGIAALGEVSRALSRSGRVTTLSRGGNQAVSLVIGTVQGMNPSDLLKAINRLNRLSAPGQAASAPPVGGGAPFAIVAATPNWLTSGCPAQGGGVGGPGGMPVAPAVAPSADAWRINLPPALATSGGDGDGVHVAILDTAPCDADIERAFARWGAVAQGQSSPQHPLIASLLRPQGPLNIYHAGGAHLLQTVDYHLDAHHYPMPDHGLFIAGIIHSIVPRARIHLIEALNSYGVGTLETFAQAFRVVQLLAAGRDPGQIDADNEADVGVLAGIAVGTVPVALNCSFMFNVVPNTAASDPELRADAELTTAMGNFPNVWQALIGNEHVPIVAAAGNDRTVAQFTSNIFPAERYPAAFDDVVGVGALDSSGVPTMYTDIAQAGASVGLAVFGGDVTPISGPEAPSPYAADANKGMLGIFVGTRFPDGTPNRLGWARWAGTSFSAPVVTGIIARSLVGPSSSTREARVLHDAVIAPLLAASSSDTPVGRGLTVTQG